MHRASTLPFLACLLLACPKDKAPTSTPKPRDENVSRPRVLVNADRDNTVATPKLDNDGDGIADEADKCPTLPEDKNGFQDDDGCPDQDVIDKQRKVDDDKRKADDDKRKADERKADEEKRKIRASGHFKQGKAFHDARAYDEAITEYEAAHALAPAPGLLYNLGQVYRLRAGKGDAQKALDYYKQYVAAESQGKAADDARSWIVRLTLELKKKSP